MAGHFYATKAGQGTVLRTDETLGGLMLSMADHVGDFDLWEWCPNGDDDRLVAQLKIEPEEAEE